MEEEKTKIPIRELSPESEGMKRAKEAYEYYLKYGLNPELV